MKKMCITLLMISVSFLACEDSVLAESEKVAVPNTQTCPYDSLANELVCSEKTYKTVVIGDQIWMAENLNFGTFIADSLSESEYQASNQKFCKSNQESNCDSDGGLYQWHTTMGFGRECVDATQACINKASSSEFQGLCPSGWHLPAQVEWEILEVNLGGASVAGQKMKLSSFGGTNSSGFSALGAGLRSENGGFFAQSSYSYFWEAESNSGLGEYIRYLSHNNDELKRSKGDKLGGFSIRCLKN